MGIESGNGERASDHASEKLDSTKIKKDLLSSISTATRLQNMTGDTAPMGEPLSAVSTLRRIEPRILLDAAGIETAEMVMETVALQQAETYFDQSQSSDLLPAVEVGALIPAGTGTSSFEGADNAVLNDESGHEFSPDTAPDASDISDLPDVAPVSNTIVFVDSGVEDLDALIAQIDPSFEVIVLSADSDGVEQIAHYLQDRSDIEAIHIISHGRSGTLELGNAKLTAASMIGNHSDELAVVRDALAEDADLMIYGCDFASGSRGVNAVEALVRATGADVAASDDLTGASALGADWELEVRSGEITALALAPTQWASTLDLTITDVGVGGTSVSGPAVDALAQQLLGSGVTLTSVTYSGGAQQAATFDTGPGNSFGNDILTFNDGVIFSTGTASSVAGPNSQSGFTVNAPGVDGDADFNALAGNSTFDASYLEVTFTPDVPPGASAGDTGRMTMEIVFGSDEYNEYVYGGVNDTLAVLINGVNQAVVPNGLAIGIDTINDAASFNPSFGSPTLDPNPEHTGGGFESANPSLYTNNETNAFNTQMDGFTITIPVTFDVIVGQQNTMKIGIADTGDAAFDSWMFVKADSAQTVIIAENDNITTPTDVPYTLDVTANDYDLQGDALTVTHILGQVVNPGDTVILASGATVTVAANGDLTVAGDGVNTVNDAFTYSITDGNGGTSTAFVNVTLTAPNSAPVAVDDGPVTISNNITQNIDVVGNDTDVDGQTLSVTHIVDPANPGTQIPVVVGTPVTFVSGTQVELLPDGTLDVTPPQNGTGPQTFDYIVSDGVLSDQATVNLDIVNTDPVAQDDALAVNEDGPVISGDLLADNGNGVDSDANGNTITVTSVNGSAPSVGSQITLPSGALLTVNANGSYDYDPNGAFESLGAGDTTTDTFTYTIDDGNGGTDTATATVTITGANDTPVLDLDTNDVTAAGVDFEGTYTENDPAINIVEPTFTLSDPDGDLVELVVTLTNGQIGDTIQFPSSMPGGITASVLPVATLTSAGPLTLTLTGTAATTDADWNAVLAAVTFLPSTNDVHNPDPTTRIITVEASDSQSVSTGLATATINVIPENDPPTLDLDDDNSGGVNAGNYAGTFTEDGGAVPIHSEIIITDLDNPDLQSATVTLDNPQTDDQVLVDGVLVYDNGSIVSGSGTSNGVGYTVTLVGGDPVIAFNTVDTIANYTAALESVSFNNTSQEPDTTDRIFNVALNDGSDVSATRTATISVVEVNDPPKIQDPLNPGVEAPAFTLPALSSDDAETVTGNPLADFSQYFFDVDPSDTLSYNVTGLPTGLTFNPATGEVTGTVDPSASQGGPLSDGVYNVQIEVSDGDDTTIVNFDWNIANPAPVAQNDDVTIDEDGTLSGDVFADNGNGIDTDPDGDSFNVALVDGNAGGVGNGVTGSTGGTFTINPDGTYDFDPGTDFQDLDDTESRDTTITYTIDDGEGGTSQATITVTVMGSNDGPVVIDPNDPFPDPNDPPAPADPDNVIPDVNGNDGQPLVPVDVSTYFVDVDGEPLTFGFDPLDPDVPVWLSIDPVTGEITGTPPSDASQGGPGSNGVYPITITATDPDGEVVTTTLDFTISNLPPVAVDDVSTGDEDNDQTGNVLTDAVTGDSDTSPDSDPLVVTDIDGFAVATGSPAIVPLTYGTVTMNEDGSWTFEPNAAANQLSDTDAPIVETLTYTIDDGNGGTDTATLEITVNGINDPVQVIDPNDPSTDPSDPSYDPVNPTVIPDPDNLIPDVSATDGETPASIPTGDYFADAEGDTLVFSATDLPAGLTINPATGEITGSIDPDASQGGNGGPGIYNVVITATDPQNNTATTTLTYTITNPAPVAQNDDVTIDEDGTLSGDVFADNGNGIDQDGAPDSDPIIVSEVAGNPGNVAMQTPGVNGGVFIINQDGTFDFDPGTDFQDLDVGESRDTTITYTIDDGNGGTDMATITVTVSGSNDAPVMIDPNDPYPDPNDPPVPADPDNVIPDVSASDGEMLAPLDVSPYFVDVDDEPLTFGFDPLDPDVPAWLSIDPVSGVITGTPPADASQGGPNNDGVYPITVTATDPDNEVVTTTVDFTISNLAPDANDDAVNASEDGIASGSVFADNGNGVDADTAPDSDPIVVSAVNGIPSDVGNAVGGDAGGTFTVNDDGTFDFDPGTDFQDLDDGESRTTSVSYTIDDGNGGFDTAMMTVTVMGSNDAPVIIDPNVPMPDPNDPPVPADPDNVIPDMDGSDATPLTPLDVTPYFHDVEGDPLTFALDPLTTPPWLTIDSNGVISGTPPSDASQGGPASDGVYVITIIGEDDNGEQVTTTVDFTIVNIPPETSGLPAQLEVAGEGFEADVTGGFNDPDGDTLTYTAAGLPGGLVLDPATGIISGTIDGSAVGDAPNGDGIYSVVITADDGEGGLVSTTFVFTVTDPAAPESQAPAGPALSPIDQPETDNGTIEPDLIVDKAANGISSLGPDTGLFDTDHPITEALYQISPLSESISLDAFGHPVTDTYEWIEKTRDALEREIGSNDPAFALQYYSGGDAKVAVGGTDYVVRTLAWDGLVYLEVISSNRDMAWEVDSLNGASASKISDTLGNNLIAFQSSSGPAGNSLVLIGSDRNGNEILLELQLDVIGGQFQIGQLSVKQQAAGFSGQLYAISNQSMQEARALLQKSI